MSVETQLPWNDSIDHTMTVLTEAGIVENHSWDNAAGVLEVTLTDDYVEHDGAIPTEDTLVAILDAVYERASNEGWSVMLTNSVDGGWGV